MVQIPKDLGPLVRPEVAKMRDAFTLIYDELQPLCPRDRRRVVSSVLSLLEDEAYKVVKASDVTPNEADTATLS